MQTKTTSPSLSGTAFDCPHCGAFTTQYWYELHGEAIANERRTPHIPDEQWQENVRELPVDHPVRATLLDWMKKMERGQVFLGENGSGKYTSYPSVNNLFISKCFNCQEISVWVHQSLVYPPQKSGSAPNQDLPDEVLQDYEEARNILNLSPRGAAALLRLCVQKLCAWLGEKGKNIDDDIASLVGKGLNPLVQKSLDIVRVIGNEAVHPGVIDLKDNRDTALTLLDVVNLIADQMITHPNAINHLYDQLPQDKKKAIERRNEKASKKIQP